MSEAELPLGLLLTPHRWAMLPAVEPRALCAAVLTIAQSPEGQVLFNQLIITYLLSHPADLRGVGKQDVVRELLDLIQQGLLARQQRQGVDNGRE